jgi:5'(3')-deoxyribonucleotidase
MDILLDVDSVVIDICKVWFSAYNKDYDDNMTDERITNWHTHEFVKPECGLKIYDYLKNPNFYVGAPEILGAIPGIWRLEHQGHDITFLSAGFHTGKIDWLQEHKALPESRMEAEQSYIIAYKKRLFCADLLIDDGPHNVSTSKIPAILFDQPWNRYLNYFPRAKDWNEVLDLVDNYDCWKDKAGVFTP